MVDFCGLQRLFHVNVEANSLVLGNPNPDIT